MTQSRVALATIDQTRRSSALAASFADYAKFNAETSEVIVDRWSGGWNILALFALAATCLASGTNDGKLYWLTVLGPLAATAMALAAAFEHARPWCRQRVPTGKWVRR